MHFIPAGARRFVPGILVFLGIVLLFALAIPLMFYITTKPYISASDASLSAPVALVLGASVKNNDILSPILIARADAAIALYRAHKVSKILVSGDNGSVSYNEVSPVGRYLLAAGIPEQDIFLDHAGFDTYSSMYRAEHVFDVSSVIIVSQAFHLPRAVFIARALGIHAEGYAAPGGGLENTLREIPACDKAFIDIVFSRVAQYVGQQIPISGDGSSTWP